MEKRGERFIEEDGISQGMPLAYIFHTPIILNCLLDFLKLILRLLL